MMGIKWPEYTGFIMLFWNVIAEISRCISTFLISTIIFTFYLYLASGERFRNIILGRIDEYFKRTWFQQTHKR